MTKVDEFRLFPLLIKTLDNMKRSQKYSLYYCQSQQSRDTFMNFNTQGLQKDTNHCYHSKTGRPD